MFCVSWLADLECLGGAQEEKSTKKFTMLQVIYMTPQLRLMPWQLIVSCFWMPTPLL